MTLFAFKMGTIAALFLQTGIPYYFLARQEPTRSGTERSFWRSMLFGLAGTATITLAAVTDAYLRNNFFGAADISEDSEYFQSCFRVICRCFAYVVPGLLIYRLLFRRSRIRFMFPVLLIAAFGPWIIKSMTETWVNPNTLIGRNFPATYFSLSMFWLAYWNCLAISLSTRRSPTAIVVPLATRGALQSPGDTDMNG